MAPKKIKVVINEGGEISKEKISSNEGYEKMLARLRVQSIKDNEGYNIDGFPSLEDGGTYTLGQPRHQQDGEFCCSFCFALCCAILYASFVVRMRIEFNGLNRA